MSRHCLFLDPDLDMDPILTVVLTKYSPWEYPVKKHEPKTVDATALCIIKQNAPNCITLALRQNSERN